MKKQDDKSTFKELFLRQRTKKEIIEATIIATIYNIFTFAFLCPGVETVDYPKVAYDDAYELTIDDIKNIFDNNQFLSDEEKAYLYNEDYFNYLLEYINQDKNIRRILFDELSYLDIEEDNSHGNLGGYVIGGNKSDIYINNLLYNQGTYELDKTLGHEFVHVTQYATKRTRLMEASAEILNQEFYITKNRTYEEETSATRILMEIIGPDPIANYIYLNDENDIINSVQPYLNKEEYRIFYKYFLGEFDDKDHMSFDEIYEVLSLLYKNKYNADINDNLMINALRVDNNYYYSRHYFDEDKMDEDYYTTDEKENNYCDLETGLVLGDILELTYLEGDKEIKIHTRDEYLSYPNRDNPVSASFEFSDMFLEGNKYAYPWYKKFNIEPINKKFEEQFTKKKK
jgi:hypothetical protein